jgi:glutamate-1-semialdehyde 2,1-aminomutase
VPNSKDPDQRSRELFARAGRVIPGGVNSPVRAFGGVGGTPIFAAWGQGAHLHDVDGRTFIDFVQSWGALLFGHARAEIVEAAAAAAARGTSFGAPTEAEVELAERIVSAVPGVEMVRLVSSGTEAAMSAVRLARGATGRPRILKFEGCYHGHADALLASAGSGVATFGIPGSPGVTAGAAADTIVVPFNDLEAVEVAFAGAEGGIACVLVEPVPANMGVVPADAGFLAGLRSVCDRHGAVLAFDEVISGFRVAYGGAQSLFGITPDLTVLGKVVGGGLPLAAFGGRADLMANLAPEGPVYQAGTLAGNPVAVAAGLTALRLAEAEDPYPALLAAGERLQRGLAEAFADAGVPAVVQRETSLFSLFFAPGPLMNFQDVKGADHARYAAFFHAMLHEGVYLPPSGYEAWFLSAAHGEAEVERTLEAARRAARRLSG